MATFWKKFVTTILYLIAFLLILAALLVSLTRLLTPVLEHHRLDFENWASDLLKKPVSINNIQIYWHIYQPQLVLNDVSILDLKTHKPTFDIPQIKITISILRSLLKRTVMLDQLKIIGVHLSLQKSDNGQIKIQGLKGYEFSDEVGKSLGANEVLDWIFLQPNLLLEQVAIDFITPNKVNRSITLDKLILSNTSSTHHLVGLGRLNQEIPTKVHVNFHWKGELNDINTISANLYLYLEGVSLPQWLSQTAWHDFQIKQGLGSTKIWLTWDKNSWQKIQTQLQVYDLEIYSAKTKKTIEISRLNGNFGWKRENNNEIIAGDNILIDFPEDLWPLTNFTVQYQVKNDLPEIQKIHVGYLNLAESYQILQKLGFDFEKERELLSHLNVKGELREINIQQKQNIFDLSNLYLTGQFNNISIDEWENWPSLSHVSGFLIWNGQQGKAKLDSKEMSVGLKRLFNSDLIFDHVLAEINWNKDNQQFWQLSIKEINAENSDLSILGNLKLNFPEKKLPIIDLIGQFNIFNVAHIPHYLPVKIFDDDLATWLQKAFLTGELNQGSFTLKGPLNDFPFDQKNGIFAISGKIKNLDLNFSPEWPIIKKLNGQLYFSNRSLKIRTSTGSILGIDLGQVNGSIPYIGSDKPQILNLTSFLKGDLSQGMHFIQNTPLQKILGSHVKKIQLQGPMKLDLALSIPLKKSERIQVLGDVAMRNANLKLAEWNLSLDKLTGTVQFSDKSIASNVIKGELFNLPMTLVLSTQSNVDKKNEFLANIQGQIKMEQLATWLNLPIGQWAEGKTNFQSTINLNNNENKATEITISTDLQGVALKLPDNYSKKNEDLAHLNLAIQVLENKPLQFKFDYKKLLSGSISVEKKSEKFDLIGGEFKLGGGPIDWSTEPGFLISGNVNKINSDTLQPLLNQLTKLNQNGSQHSLFNLNLFRGINLQINSLELFGIILNQIHLKVTKALNAFVIDLSNNELVGKITWPLSSSDMVYAKFENLNLSIKGLGGKIINPSYLPSFSFIGDRVTYQNNNLGRVSLTMLSHSHRMLIKKFNMESNLLKLDATGEWSKSNTHLVGELKMPNVSELLNAWGFDAKNLVESSGSLNFNLTWPGSPFNPSVKYLSGNASLVLTKGRIVDLGNSVDAKMGVGRLLNLFSLQSIPRRLSLDFSDLFQKGYSFDEMKGDFELKDGDAYTKNAYFNGPIAKVDISGRIGLASKNNDMKLSITPYVTSSLPVVATFAVNPLVGAAAWVVDKIVSRQVSKFSTYHYLIKGSWDHPQWEEEKVGGKK